MNLIAISGSTFCHNSVFSSYGPQGPNPGYGYGGGLQAGSGISGARTMLEIITSMFSQNSALDGGGLVSTMNSVTIRDSTFSSNSARLVGFAFLGTCAMCNAVRLACAGWAAPSCVFRGPWVHRHLEDHKEHIHILWGLSALKGLLTCLETLLTRVALYRQLQMTLTTR